MIKLFFSLLCLKYKVPTLSSYEYWYPKADCSYRLKADWISRKDFPIHAMRDKDLVIMYSVKIFIRRLPKRIILLFQIPFSLIRAKKVTNH